jgi:hypothetical protein
MIQAVQTGLDLCRQGWNFSGNLRMPDSGLDSK